jgi:Flp pilus assembly protein TadG
MNHSSRLPGRLRRDRGAVIIYTAFFLVVLLGFVGLGVDVAKFMATRTQLQRAADAAALAGASAVDYATGQVMADTATARAIETAALNRAFVGGPKTVTLLANDVTFPSVTEVRVTVRRDPSTDGALVTHVAQVLGVRSLDLSATATAKAEPAGAIDCGLAPLFVNLPEGETPRPGCSPGYVLKVGGGMGSNGNYGGLTYPTCPNGECAGMGTTGADLYRCLLENGFCCTVASGQTLDTEPGNMSGPTRQSMQARFNADTDRREGICYGDYQGNGQRVVYVPVTTAPEGGRATVRVLSFGAFFLKNIPGSGNNSFLEGEFLYTALPGSGGGNNGEGTLYTLRLVE